MAGWTTEEEALLTTLLERNPNAATDEIRPFFPGHSVEAVGRKVRRRRNPDTSRVPTSIMPPIPEAPHVPASSMVLFFDFHAPFQDAPFVNSVQDLALAWGVRDCGVGGDLLNMGYFSRFPKRRGEDLERELDAAEGILDALSANFSTVTYCMGNHEQHMIDRALNNEIEITRWSRLFNLNPNVEVTERPYFTFDGAHGDFPWVAGHPAGGSRIPSKAPLDISAATWPAHHIASGHTHLWGMCRTKDGLRWAIDVGGCFDRKRIAYAQLSFSSYPRMCEGALIVKNGRPYLLSPETDFDAMNRMYSEKVAR